MARAHQRDSPDRGAPDPGVAPFDSGYLTDGETLFRIERTLVEDAHGDLLVELEDCVTLELIVCSARSVTEIGLRPVQPLTLAATPV